MMQRVRSRVGREGFVTCTSRLSRRQLSAGCCGSWEFGSDQRHHLTAVLVPVLGEVPVAIDRDLDGSVPRPPGHFVHGYSVRQGHGRPFVPQDMRCVFPKSQPFDGSTPGSADKPGYVIRCRALRQGTSLPSLA